MTVSEFAELRTELRKVNTSYTLAKKTIVRIAVKEVLNIDLDLKNNLNNIMISNNFTIIINSLVSFFYQTKTPMRKYSINGLVHGG